MAAGAVAHGLMDKHRDAPTRHYDTTTRTSTLGGATVPEIAQSTARFSSGSSRPPKGSGHGGPFEGAARRPRCGLRWRRWTWLFALSSCITWRASDFRRRSCAVTIARVHRCTQLLAPRRTLAGLTEGGGACPSRVLKFHRPGVFITLAARFFRLRAPSMSCTQ